MHTKGERAFFRRPLDHLPSQKAPGRGLAPNANDHGGNTARFLLTPAAKN